jgi:hypothetical protein
VLRACSVPSYHLLPHLVAAAPRATTGELDRTLTNSSSSNSTSFCIVHCSYGFSAHTVCTHTTCCSTWLLLYITFEYWLTTLRAVAHTAGLPLSYVPAALVATLLLKPTAPPSARPACCLLLSTVARLRTEEEGASSADDCVAPPGYRRVDATTVAECASGTYKEVRLLPLLLLLSLLWLRSLQLLARFGAQMGQCGMEPQHDEQPERGK